MLIIIILLVLILTFILIRKSQKPQIEDTRKFNLKKLLLGILLFMVLFCGYAILITLICFIILGGGDGGIWGLAIVPVIFISPILSFITAAKILNKGDNNKITRI